MRFPKTLTFLILSMMLALAPAAWARQRNVAPTFRSAPTGHLPGTRSVAASLPRHGGVAPTETCPDKVGRSAIDVGPNSVRPGPALLGTTCANLNVSATTAGASPGNAANPAKPITQEQVTSMVRDGFGDESGARLIEQRGIDFAPTEDFIQTLKAAGASEAFLNALRAAKPPARRRHTSLEFSIARKELD